MSLKVMSISIRQFILSNAKMLGLSKNFTVTRFKSAYSNLVYNISSDSRNLVLKIIVDPLIDEGKIAEKELALLKKFKSVSPKTILISSYNGHPAIFEEFLRGQNLAEVNLIKSDLEQAARLLAQIHSTKIDAKLKRLLSRSYTKVPVENLENIASWLKRLHVEEPLISRIIKIYKALQPHLSTAKKVKTICHGDFKFLNLIKTKQGLKTYDWELAIIGDPAFDVAVLFLTSEYDSKNPLLKKQKDIFLQSYLKYRKDKTFVRRVKIFYNFGKLQIVLWLIRDYYAHDFLKQNNLLVEPKVVLIKYLEYNLNKLEASL